MITNKATYISKNRNLIKYIDRERERGESKGDGGMDFI